MNEVERFYNNILCSTNLHKYKNYKDFSPLDCDKEVSTMNLQSKEKKIEKFCVSQTEFHNGI